MNAAPHPLKGPNPFKLGIFSANADGGLAITDVPERWRASWDDNRAVAAIADKAGIEFLLPIARWKGFGGKNRVFDDGAMLLAVRSSEAEARVVANVAIGAKAPGFAVKTLNGKPLADPAAHLLQNGDSIVVGYGPDNSFPHAPNTFLLYEVEHGLGGLGCSPIHKGKGAKSCAIPKPTPAEKSASKS